MVKGIEKNTPEFDGIGSRLVSAEAVSEGHPDKLSDEIADELLDLLLVNSTHPEQVRSAVEVLGCADTVVVGGEVSVPDLDDDTIHALVVKAVENVYNRVGYQEDLKYVKITNCLVKQSAELHNVVNYPNTGLTAGDQGVTYGYAFVDTDDLMPFAQSLVNRLIYRLEDVRHEGVVAGLKPDAKAEIVWDKADNDYPIKRLIISSSYDPDVISLDQLRDAILDHVIAPVLKDSFTGVTLDTLVDWAQHGAFHINDAGAFTICGYQGDTGLTGRKLLADAYGVGYAHGGGATSGKDATKVDRSGAYFARYLAKNALAVLLAKPDYWGSKDVTQVGVRLTYQLGNPVPVEFSLNVPNLADEKLAELEYLIKNKVDFSLTGVIQMFGLTRPIYRYISSGGNYGKTEKGFLERYNRVMAPLCELDELPYERIDFFGLNLDKLTE